MQRTSVSTPYMLREYTSMRVHCLVSFDLTFKPVTGVAVNPSNAVISCQLTGCGRPWYDTRKGTCGCLITLTQQGGMEAQKKLDMEIEAHQCAS